MKKTSFLLSIGLFFVQAAHAGDKESNIFSHRYIRQTMMTAALWQLDHPKHELYDWTNGAFYAGVTAAWQATGDKRLKKAVMEMGEKNSWKPGPRLLHADDIAICQSYLDLYRTEKEEKMMLPFRTQMDMFLTTPFPQKGIEVITWWWCDALFMAPPALVKLSMITGDSRYMDKSDQLFHECYNLLYDKEEHLFARDLGYVIKGDSLDRYEANGKKIFWSRGNGWVMGGLVRLLSELPAEYHGRDFYVRLYQEMAARIATLQQDDGLWRASLLDPASYPGGEASGSGFYTYALAWGINHGLLNRDEFLPVVKKAWAGLNGLIQPGGFIGWTQPIGADPRKNFSAESWEVYGTGAFLLAGSEMLRIKD